MTADVDSVSAFIRELASPSPAPGGGGAAAVTASLASALASMAAGLTSRNKKYASLREELESLSSECESLSRFQLECIDRDAEGFLPLPVQSSGVFDRYPLVDKTFQIFTLCIVHLFFEDFRIIIY